MFRVFLAGGLLTAGMLLGGTGLVGTGSGVAGGASGPGPVVSAAAAEPPAGALWAELDDTADSILQRRQTDWSVSADRYRTVEERSYALNRLLDAALERLSDGEATGLRARIADLRQRLAAREAEIADLRAGMVALPAERCGAAGGDASWVGRQIACAFATSRADQAARIAEARRQADELTAAIETAKQEFSRSLEGLGIRLSVEQVDGLLRLATAGDVVAAHTVYDNLRRVNEELHRATVSSDESVEVARRYYGLYAVLLEVALHMHERFLDTVRNHHLPRLTAVEEEARAARAEAADMRRRERDGVLAAQLDANMKALDLTLQAASLYRRTLEEQVQAVTAAWKRVGRQRDVAVNTWRTVRASADMLAMMNESGRAFDALLTLELPPPRVFDNQQLKREFERLTDRLVAEKR